MDRLHINHLMYLKNLVKTHDEVFFHGNGQIYVTKETSEFAKNFGSPNSYSEYVICFKRNDRIPKSLEELKSMFYNEKTRENIAKSQLPTNKNLVSVSANEVQNDNDFQNILNTDEIETEKVKKYKKTK
jgi:hypothetical protein